MSDGVWEELEPSGPRLAERVLVTVRRRRRALLVGASALAVPVAILLGLLIGSPERGSAVDRRAAAGAAVRVDDRAAVYVAAIRAERGAVYVSAALPSVVRRMIRQDVGPRVRFATAPRGADGHQVVVLGRLRVSGNRATLARDYFCGALCGSGSTIHLIRATHGWRVTGRTGPNWLNWTG